MKLKTEADPDGSGSEVGITHEAVYDEAGREVASRTNDDPWTCVSYDERGRTIQTVIPTINGRAGRTVTSDYAYQGSPFKTQVTDSVAGNTVSEVDLLGRTVAGEDQFGNAYAMTYDDLGRMTQQTSPVGTEEYAYDDFDRVTGYKLGGVTYASVGYDEYSRIDNVVYDQAASGGNKLTLEQVKYDALQRNNGAVYRFTDNKAFDETVTHSQSGVVTGYTNAFDGQSVTNSYQYDSVGRLTQAIVDQNRFEYGYATPNSGVCDQAGVNLNAHKNSNRTSYTHTDLSGGGSGTVISDQTYCYDQADRLVGTSDVQVGTPVYDNHGNTTQLAGDGTVLTLEYDASDTNVAIEQGGNRVEYVKSAGGSVLRKKEYQSGSLAKSYRYIAGGAVMQACDLADENACSSVDTYVDLPGGALLTLSPSNPTANEQAVYSLPNFHGDTAITAGKDGTPTSSVNMYEPFGLQASSVTFGTSGDPNNSSNESMGWAADPTRKQESLFSVAIVQMGARVYLPSLGRFLQVDPVEGGTANSYVYVNDPVNGEDYSGLFSFRDWVRGVTQFTWGVVSGGARAVSTKAKYDYKKLTFKVQTTLRQVETGRDKARDWCNNNAGACDAVVTVLSSSKGGGGKGAGRGKPNTSARVPINNFKAQRQAQKLGFTKIPGYSHGQFLFQKGTRYLSPDFDGHKGGAWKSFTKKGGKLKREGTYSWDLKTRIGD